MSMFGNLSANQINAGMGLGPGGVGDQNQALLNSLYGPQGFGGQTAQYAAAGAAAGRNTGGFGGYGGMNDPFSPVGGYNGMDAQAGGGINPNDPGNIALYNQIMHGGSPYGAYPSPATNAPQSSYGYGLTSGGNFASPSLGFGASSAATDPASQAYFAAYPDVAASGMSAAQHYAQFGQKEGRNGFGLDGGGASFADRFGAAPPVDYNLQISPSPLPRGIYDGNFNTLMPNSPPANFNERFGVFGAAANDPASQAYFEAYPDVAKSGMSAAQHFAQFGQAEGRNGFGLSAGTMAQGGNPSWFDAGAPGGGFNTYGMPGSGNIGKQDAFSGMQNLDTPEAKYLNANPDVLAWARGSGMDYQTAARTHASRFGNNEGRDTFGMTNANPNFQQGGGFGMGSAFDPSTYGGSTGNPAFSFDQRFPAGKVGGSAGFGGYPQQPMASDNMANQQQMIQDLYKTLGIIDNAGESGRYGNQPYTPSGNTLTPRDVQIGGS